MNKQNNYKFIRVAGLAAVLVLAPAYGAGQDLEVGVGRIEELYRENANMPGGKFTSNTIDMRIKIANGHFTWSRTYDGNGWRFSPQLAGLSLSKEIEIVTLGAVGGGGGAALATPTLPAQTAEAFGYVGAYAGYDHGLVEKPDQIIRNGAKFESDDKFHFYQQRGQSGRYFMERSSVAGREGLYYRWQDRAGDWILYDAFGWVDSYGNSNGLTASIEYENLPVRDGKQGKRLKAVIDRNGNRILAFVYDQAHPTVLREVREILLPGEPFAPRVVKYDYDFGRGTNGNGVLTQVIDAAGNPTSFDYDGMDRLTSITDGEGHTRRLEYAGKSSRKVREVAADGTESTFAYSYDKAKKQYTVQTILPSTAAGRRVIDEIYDSEGIQIRREINGKLSDAFTKGDRESVIVDSVGRETRTTLNEFDLVTRVAYSDSTSISMEFSPFNLRLTKQVDAAGVVSTSEYDENGNLNKYVQAAGTSVERTTTYINDANGLPLSATLHGRTEPSGVVTADATWKFEYDGRGNLRKVTDPEGSSQQYLVRPDEAIVEHLDARNNKTVFDFDGSGRPLAVKTSLGQIYTNSFDKAGNLIKQTNPLGRTIHYTYDTADRVIQVLEGSKVVAGHTYNNAGSKIRTTDADGRVSLFEYDNLERLVKTTDGVGNATEYRYEVPAQLGLTAPATQGINWLPSEIASPTFTQRIERDAADRVVRTTTSFDSKDGVKQAVTRKEYNPHSLVTRILKEGEQIAYSYDALAHATEMVDQERNITKAVRDIRGNLIQLIDADGRATKFEYDRNDRLIKEIQPLGQTKFYQYDGAGNLQTSIDQNGSKTEYQYDELNRLISSVSTQADGIKAQTTLFYWNFDDSLASYKDTDHIRNLSNEVALTYDELGRKNGTTVTYPGGYKLQYSYGYSAAGLKTRLTWPDGTPIEYSYSSNAILERVTIPSEGNIQFSTFKWGAPTEVKFPGGMQQQRQFDGILNLENLTVSDGQQPSILKLSYGYNNRAELTASNRVENIDGDFSAKAKAFEFDAADRLVKVKTDNGGLSGEGTQTFGYDHVGNRISDTATVGKWAYDANNRLIQKGTDADATRYEYDDAGNLTKKIDSSGRLVSYSYDSHNRLIAVNGTNGELIARYGYDPLNRRIWREQFRTKELVPLPKAKRTFYLYSDEGLIAEAEQEIQLGKDGAIVEINSPVIVSQYGPRPNEKFTTGILFAKTKDSDGNDVFAYFQHDRLGMPIQAFNKFGMLLWSADNDAYGKTTVSTPVTVAGRATITNNLRLPGQIEDAETGLHYNWNRYYDPSMGRYIQSDPIGLAGGINTYIYANGNPVKNVDADGRIIFVYFFGWAAANIIADGAIIGGVGWYAAQAARPKGMNKYEERHWDRTCKNSDDPCGVLKAETNKALTQAESKMEEMLDDPKKLYLYANYLPNPEATGSPTTWWNHHNDLNGRITNIWGQISLGRRLNCDMSTETARALRLSVPNEPRKIL